MENFTVQLRGSKRWKLWRGQVEHPLRGCTPHYGAIDTVEQQLKVQRMRYPDHQFHFTPPSCEEVVLRPGSVMYFPAGCWHRVECEEDSLSINISLVSSTCVPAQRMPAAASPSLPPAPGGRM